MSKDKRHRLRTRFWVNSDIQARFVIFFVVACAVVSVLLACAVFGYVWSAVTQFVSVPVETNPKEVFADLFTGVLVGSGVLFAVFAVCGGLLLVFISHRVAGPIYRIQKLLDATDMSAGTALRSGDALQELYGKVCALSEKHTEIESRHRELVDLVGN